jgi:chlorophyll synthase
MNIPDAIRLYITGFASMSNEGNREINSISWFNRLVRPIAWIVFLFPFTVGFGLGAIPETGLIKILSGFLSFVFVMCFGFTVNAIGDVRIDRFHDGHSKDMNLAQQPLVTGEISQKHAWILVLLFLVGSLITAVWISYLFFLSILVLNILGLIYSIPPIRLKVRPGLDIVCNALIGMMCFVAGVALGGSIIPLIVYLGVFLMAATFYIPTVVTDFDFDKRAGEYTSAVAFGPTRVLASMIMLTSGLILVSVFVFLTESVELQILAGIMIVYTSIFTIASRLKLRDDKWVLHENWILVPFGIISLVVTIYGLLKIYGIMIL